MWLESCRQSFVKMHADKEHFETVEIKTKAQILPFQEKNGMMFVYINSFFCW
jgi:coatomer subunit beta